MTNIIPPKPDPLEGVEQLRKILLSYDSSSDPHLRSPEWQAFEQSLTDRISAYGAATSERYGQKQMIPHLYRAADLGKRMLLKAGFSQPAAENFRRAFMLHDLGKTHESYRIENWTLPKQSDEVRLEKKQHIVHGIEILDEVLAALDEPSRTEFSDHPHVRMIRSLMLYHHERLDGKGTLGLPPESQGLLIQVACIADAYDGDRIHRPHQPERRSPESTIRRMMTDHPEDKYYAAFDPKVLCLLAQVVEELEDDEGLCARLFSEAEADYKTAPSRSHVIGRPII